MTPEGLSTGRAPLERGARSADTSMWNLRTLAECLLATPKGAPINEGLARDLARSALDTITMDEQSAETLRYLHDNYHHLVDEMDDDNVDPLIKNYLYWLIEDVAPAVATGDCEAVTPQELPARASVSGNEPAGDE